MVTGKTPLESALEYLPGIGILILGALIARTVAPRIPGIDELLVAIAVGVLLANLAILPEWATQGLQTHKVWLGGGIVLMGATLALEEIVESGALVLLAVLIVSGFTLLYVEFLSKVLFDVTDRLASLLAAGASICGVSAVVAVAGSIDASEEHVAYAAGTVLVFDTITLLVYPVIGGLLDLSAQLYGIWAGLSMFSTGPVVAVGFAHSDAAGQWATITKLTRNALIGIVALGYAMYYARKRLDATDSVERDKPRWLELWDRFPKFVAGFLLLALIGSAGLLSAHEQQAVENAYSWLFLFAFVGLGTDLTLHDLRHTGIRPMLVVLISFMTVSALTLLLLSIVLS